MLLRIFLIATLLVSAALATPQAIAGSTEDAAYDERDNFVIDMRGNCVRTKWMQGEDPCNPTPPPVVEKAPPPPPIVTDKEARTIHFDFNSAELDAEAIQKLDHLIAVINQSLSIRDVHVLGYTDQIGSDGYNLELSNRRVQAAMDYLAPRTRVHPKKAAEVRGLGKAPAEAECATLKSRAERISCMRKERRVEITFTYEQQKK